MSAAERERELFHQASELPPDERDAFLVRECEGDADLLARVRSLLSADAAAADQSFWARSALEHEAIAATRLADAAIGSRIGPYRIVAAIGAGGMGAVYRAVRADAEYDQVVAIKRLKYGLDSAAMVAGFRAERQILATLDHPNIARLLDGGTDDQGMPYLVMEFVEGSSPAAYCESRQLSLPDRLRLFLPVCGAVHYAHQRMVVHRDLKPGNILVTADGTPKLLDFGIAALVSEEGRAERSAMTVGLGPVLTVRYASPEQINGEQVTTASDVYSLGVCLYELLTQRSPYGDVARPTHQLMRAVADGDIIPATLGHPELKGDLENILAKALKTDPAQRYGSADQLADDLRRHLDGRPVQARGDAWSYVAASFVRRHKLAVAAVALIFASLVGGIITTSRAQARADRRFEEVRRLARAVMFDYHDALENLPGATPVRQRMISDALQYLDSLSAEADEPSLQREVVDAYVRVSHAQGNPYFANLGDTAGGLVSSGKAVAAAERLLAADSSATSVSSAAQAFTADADLLYTAGKLVQAEPQYLRASELFERALASEPKNVEWLLAYAAAAKHFGDLYGGTGIQNMGRTEDAIARYQISAAIAERAVRERPNDGSVRLARYQAVYTIAGNHVALGRNTEAAAGFREAASLIEENIRLRPDNVLDKQELAFVSLRLGQLLMDEGQFAQAASRVERSLQIMEGLAVADPRNRSIPRNLSVVRGHYARALRESGRYDEALSQARLALATFQELSAGNSASAELRGDVAIGRRSLAETLIAAGRPQPAISEATDSITTLDALAREGDDANFRTHMARGLVVRGEARAMAGDASAARTDFAAAAAAFTALSATDSANAVLKADLARAQRGLQR